ncbi:MAG: galactokinase [Proteobacteria bacterium]|jgi:D-glycero-alpha-D-manno-heptose-7-phosphate kinase|nr:galactokinase [Pseudomonadota bacterium]
MKFFGKSPTRVDLAGGTLDLWPLYNFVGGAKTVNVAIDIWTWAELTPLPQGKIELESRDLNLKKSFGSFKECLADPDPALNLLKVQLKFWNPQDGFRLVTKSESPVGGGLGGSSSLTVSMLKAFSSWLEKPFPSNHQMAEVAHNMEAQVLNTPTGTQDYYPPMSGGINVLGYEFEGITQKVLSVKGTPLESHFLLVNTGRSHHSGLNNFEVLTSAVRKDSKVIEALLKIKQVAEETAQMVERGTWERMKELFHRELDARLQLTPAFSSPEIEQLIKLSLQAGADAVKICGAGGGGCVLVWVPPHRREGVVAACQTAGFQVLGAKPVDPLPL